MGHERWTFTGRVAIVTGGASGIGRELGEELFRQGAHVVLADVEGDAANDVARDAASRAPDSSGSIVGRAVDVRDGDAVTELVDAVIDTHGHLDLMFNNAGISIGGPTHAMQPAHWSQTIDVNLNGVVNGVLAAYPRMIDQGYGHIVNTASGAGLAPMVFTVPYTTTKFAVVGLSTALRPEAATHGVRVSVLCPGLIDTPILDRSHPSGVPPMPPGTPTGREFTRRLLVRPSPVARFAVPALRGVARNQSVIVVPAYTKALWYLHRISPAATEAVGRWMVGRIG